MQGPLGALESGRQGRVGHDCAAGSKVYKALASQSRARIHSIHSSCKTLSEIQTIWWECETDKRLEGKAAIKIKNLTTPQPL